MHGSVRFRVGNLFAEDCFGPVAETMVSVAGNPETGRDTENALRLDRRILVT